MEKGKVYVLFPLESLLECVHVVQANLLLQLMHDNVLYEKTLRQVLNPNAEWQSEVFYLNRFLRNDDTPIKNNSINSEFMIRYGGRFPHLCDLTRWTKVMFSYPIGSNN